MTVTGSEPILSPSPPARFGKFELLALLARGGMAELHLARLSGPGGFRKTVVLKRIRPELLGDPDNLALFLDEARLGAAFEHPNLVATVDAGDEEGRPWIALEWLRGENLRTVLRTASARGLILPRPHAIQIALGMLLGLHHAHEARDPDGAPLDVVHRDVSPHNVIVTFEGGVKVVDFGIARATNRRRRPTALGIVRGKRGYMSPEQCRGRPANHPASHPVDRRTDLFSTGAVLFELLTGRKLYNGDDDLCVMGRILDEPAPSVRAFDPRLPVALDTIVRRALEKDPAARFPTAMAMARELEAVARAERWPLSTIALGEYVTWLFGAADAACPSSPPTLPAPEDDSFRAPEPESVIEVETDYLDFASEK